MISWDRGREREIRGRRMWKQRESCCSWCFMCRDMFMCAPGLEMNRYFFFLFLLRLSFPGEISLNLYVGKETIHFHHLYLSYPLLETVSRPLKQEGASTLEIYFFFSFYVLLAYVFVFVSILCILHCIGHRATNHHYFYMKNKVSLLSNIVSTCGNPQRAIVIYLCGNDSSWKL